MAAPWRRVTQEEEADRASPLVAAPHRGLCPAGRPPPSALVINSSPTATARHNSHDRSKSALYELLICSKTAPRGHHHCQAPQTLLFAPHHQPTQLLSMSVKDGFGGAWVPFYPFFDLLCLFACFKIETRQRCGGRVVSFLLHFCVCLFLVLGLIQLSLSGKGMGSGMSISCKQLYAMFACQ